MREVLTIPDETKELFIRFRTIDGMIASQVIENGCLTDSKYIDKGENVNLSYAEGLEKRIDELEKRIDAIEKSYSFADMKKYEVGGSFKDGVGFMFHGDKGTEALNIPKMKPVPDITLENRGPYADILRRLSALEERFNNSDSEQKELAGDVECFRVDRDTVMAGMKDLTDSLNALEKRINSRPTFDNFSLHDQRICKLESRMEDAEKKAVVAEGVRKQLAEDIKALQGRINKIYEETLADA